MEIKATKVEYVVPAIDLSDLKSSGVLCESGEIEVTNPFENGETEERW